MRDQGESRKTAEGKSVDYVHQREILRQKDRILTEL